MFRTAIRPWAALSFAVLTLFSTAQAETATNMNEFEAAIVDTLAPRVVGFGYTIVQDGQVVRSGGGGAARPGAAFTANTRVNVASVSKTVTAVALLQLLEKNGLTPNDPIGPWMPPDWIKGYGFWMVGGLQFRDLLTHRSGLQQTIGKLSVTQPAALAGLDSNAWAGLEQIVMNGVAADWAQTECAEADDDGVYSAGAPAPNGGYFGVYCYKNVNYSLMRLMIARLWQAIEPAIANIPLTADSTAGMYQAYVQGYVLSPIGIHANCYSPLAENMQTRYYDARYPTAPSTASWNNSSGLLTCGAKNWNLSAAELAKFATYMRHAEWLPAHQQILSQAMRQAMDDLRMGWNKDSNSAANPGKFWHGGDLMGGVDAVVPHPWIPGQWTAVSAERRLNTCIAKLPQNIQVAVVVNSSIRGAGLNMPQLNSKNSCQIVREAFDAAQHPVRNPATPKPGKTTLSGGTTSAPSGSIQF